MENENTEDMIHRISMMLAYDLDLGEIHERINPTDEGMFYLCYVAATISLRDSAS